MKLAAAAALALVLFLRTATGSPPRPAWWQQTAPYTYQGTVHELQPQARTLALLTGVGLAFRVVEMRVPAAAAIAAGGATLSLGDLKPGDIVRAECRLVEGQLVADRIERLSPAGTPEERAP